MSILDMSKAAAPLILAIVLARAACLHRLPKRTFPALWGLALMRLLAPLSIPSRLSIQTWLTAIPSLLTKQAAPDSVATVATATTTTARTMDAALFPQATILPTVPAAAPAPFPWLTFLWLSVACLMAVGLAVSYRHSRRRFSTSLPAHTAYLDAWLAEHPTRRRVTIRYSDQIISPLTYGILRPVILLPKSALTLREDRLGCILLHEMTHIRRFDALYKLLLAAALCVHWFNPLVWLMVHLAGRDLELACDEAVVRSLSKARKSSYAMTLIDMEERRGTSPLMASFSKNATEERIQAMMKMKHTTRWGTVLAMVLVLMMAAVFATSALATGATPTETASAAAAGDEAPEAADTSEAPKAAEATEAAKTIPANTVTVSRGGTHIYAVPAQTAEAYTYDELKAWLDEEREALDALVEEGAKGWMADEGTFTWTQEKVNDTLAPYEAMLDAIENGASIARSTNSDTAIAITRAEAVTPGTYSRSTHTDRNTTETYIVEEGHRSGMASVMEVEVIEAEPATRIYRHYSGPNATISIDTGSSAAISQYMASIVVNDQLTVDIGPYKTEDALADAVRAFCDSQVAAGMMEQSDADALVRDYE